MSRFKKILSFLIILTSLDYHNSIAESSRDSVRQFDLLMRANRSIGKKIGNFILTDQDGNKFDLKEYIGSPLIISFIYTSCIRTCNVSTAILSGTMEKMSGELGKKINTITVSFDYETDKPQKMKEYGEVFTKDFKYWRFATGDKDTLQRLANEFGFYYQRSKDGFNHLNMISIIDYKGEIYKHIYYGEDDNSGNTKNELIGSLKRLLSNTKKAEDISTSLGVIDRVKLLCSDYDPESRTYTFSYFHLTKLILNNIIFYIIPLFMLWWKELLSLIIRCKGMIRFASSRQEARLKPRTTGI
ncbi:MAG: SCO family protein [Nitrospinota bacterium]